jgi:hypothetical protein
MATYTDSLGFAKGSAALPAKGTNRSSVVSVKLDFPAIIAARAAAGATALAASDVLEVLPVPAGTIVRNVALVVETVAASGTIAIGDGSAAAGYLAAQAVSSAGTFGGVPVLSSGAFAPTLSGGKVYAAADTVDITIGTAVPATAVVRVVAELVDLNAQ